MNYWAAELTNLPEVTQPLWDYMEVGMHNTMSFAHIDHPDRKRGYQEGRKPLLHFTIAQWAGLHMTRYVHNIDQLLQTTDDALDERMCLHVNLRSS